MPKAEPLESDWFRRSHDGVLIVLRVTPNAGRDAIEGVERRDDRSACLRVRVAAVADRGRANAAVITLLAKALGVSKSTLSVQSGATSRLKTVSVSGDAETLCARLVVLASPEDGPGTG